MFAKILLNDNLLQNISNIITNYNNTYQTETAHPDIQIQLNFLFED